MLKIFFTGFALFFSTLSFADDHNSPVGIWQLVSYEVESQETGNIFTPMGKKPTGYVILTADNRISFVLTADNRKPATSIEDKAKLLDTLIAYSGTYRIENNQFITSVEVAWNPAWVGTEQARNFELEGDTLRILTPWRMMPNWPDAMTRSIVTFQAVKE